jgi:hypothetical protein
MCRLSWNLGASTSWNPMGLSRPAQGLLYLYLIIPYKVRLFNRVHCVVRNWKCTRIRGRYFVWRPIEKVVNGKENDGLQLENSAWKLSIDKPHKCKARYKRTIKPQFIYIPITNYTASCPRRSQYGCAHTMKRRISYCIFTRSWVILSAVNQHDVSIKYSSAPVFTGNTFQDLPRLCETADNTERYI